MDSLAAGCGARQVAYLLAVTIYGTDERHQDKNCYKTGRGSNQAKRLIHLALVGLDPMPEQA
jgi:hypothetical protein